MHLTYLLATLLLTATTLANPIPEPGIEADLKPTLTRRGAPSCDHETDYRVGLTCCTTQWGSPFLGGTRYTCVKYTGGDKCTYGDFACCHPNYLKDLGSTPTRIPSCRSTESYTPLSKLPKRELEEREEDCGFDCS